jgi:hypothetical protein
MNYQIGTIQTKTVQYPINQTEPLHMKMVPKVKIEFIYDETCPQIQDIRYQILEAIAESDLEPIYYEWKKNDVLHGVPSYVKEMPSPCVLINGKPIAQADSPDNQQLPYTAAHITSTIRNELQE